MYLINLFNLNIIPIPHKIEEDVIFTGEESFNQSYQTKDILYLNSRHSALKMVEMVPVQFTCMIIKNCDKLHFRKTSDFSTKI